MTARVAACARNVWKCRLIINLAINLIAAYSNKTQFQFFSLDHKVTLKSLPDTNPGIVMIIESLNYPLRVGLMPSLRSKMNDSWKLILNAEKHETRLICKYLSGRLS